MPRTAPRRRTTSRAADGSTPRTCWRPTATSGTSTGHGSRPEQPWRSGPSRPATDSSCNGTGRAGCTTTSGWRWVGCSRAGPFPAAPRRRVGSSRRLPRRGPSARVLRLRGRYPRGRVRRRRRHRLGRRHVGALLPARGSRPGRRRRPRRAAHGAERPEAQGQVRPRRTSVDEAGKESWLLLHKRTGSSSRAGTRRSIRAPVLSGRTNDEVKADPDRLWQSDLPAAQAAVALHPPTFEPVSQAELRALDRLGAAGTWEAFGRQQRVTNLDKVLFPPRGREKPVTKRDLVRYAAQIAPTLVLLPGGRSTCTGTRTALVRQLLEQGAAQPRAIVADPVGQPRRRPWRDDHVPRR